MKVNLLDWHIQDQNEEANYEHKHPHSLSKIVDKCTKYFEPVSS